MKTKIAIALALLFTTGSFAQTSEKTKSPVRKMEVAAFTQLKVDAEVEVMLIDDGQTGTAWLVGEPGYFDDISLKVKNNELVISSKRSHNYRSKITVEVHVKDLAKVTVEKEAFVFTGGSPLRSKKLDVLIKDRSKASIQSTGDINISAEEDMELVFLRKSPGVSVEN